MAFFYETFNISLLFLHYLCFRMKKFNIPDYYQSPIIGKVKEIRRINDPRKKDFSSTLLNFGPVKFHIARHFGFCFGVENAIEISYRAISENADKKIYLLSQMIHNPGVNADLLDHGIKFIQDTNGNQLIPWEDITKEDIVIIPAFGTTLEIENKINAIGIEVKKYNTTCPFVEKVWNRSQKLGNEELIQLHLPSQRRSCELSYLALIGRNF